MSVRVRIAPSPTGDPHVGTAYVALFNLIFARHFQGKFILRIEDTDRSRSKPEYEKNILDALKWCKIDWDEGPDIGGPFGPYRQSERSDIYKRYAQKLLEQKKAYKCFATPEELLEMRELASKRGEKMGYDRRYRSLSDEEIKHFEEEKRPYVVRLKTPLSGECTYRDEVKGTISVPWSDVDDQILLKSDGFPTYHLANVVDDHLMQITHVIRGDEWMSSTPKHIYLYEALGWEPPAFLHMPLLLGKDHKKLSKRKNPTSIFYFRDSGYLADALVNFLTLMGYSMTQDREIYDLEEIIEEFDPKRIGVSGAFFDIQKLKWLNQKRLIETLGEEDLWDKLKQWSFNDTFMQKLMPLVHTRIKTFSEFLQLCDFFFIEDLKITQELLAPKGNPSAIAFFYQTLIWSLDESGDWSGPSLEKSALDAAQILGLHYKKQAIPSLFGAIMGKHHGPPLYSSVTLLGKDRARVRLMQGIELLGGISSKKLALLKKGWEKKDCKDLISP